MNSFNAALKADIRAKYIKSAQYIEKIINRQPTVSVVAGSGFSNFFENYNRIASIKYQDIPFMPKTSVEGHSGRIDLLELSGDFILLFVGRSHIYEGKSVEEIVSSVIISHLLGIDNILLTNAAGGLSKHLKIGDLMLTCDTINLLHRDTSHLFDYCHNRNVELYDSRLRNEIQNKLSEKKLPFTQGVYLSTSGPSYETRAEIAFLRAIGADAVGMSTVLEASVASKLQMKCVAVSMISNILKEVKTDKLSHNDVLEASAQYKHRFAEIIKEILLVQIKSAKHTSKL